MHRWTMATRFASDLPATSRHAVHTLATTALDESEDAQLGDVAGKGRPVCAHCLIPLVPGMNCSVRVHPITQRGKRKGRRLQPALRLGASQAGANRAALRNVVRYHCTSCQHSTELGGSTKAYAHRLGRLNAEKPAASATSSPVTPTIKTAATTAAPPKTAATTATAAKTAALLNASLPKTSKHQSVLKQLIATKKATTTAQPKSFSLSDFMQSL